VSDPATRIAIVGLGTGMLMQNLVLAVQNTVSVRNIGAASSSVAFRYNSARTSKRMPMSSLLAPGRYLPTRRGMPNTSAKAIQSLTV